MQSPVFFISKRDILNKRVSFMDGPDFISINNSISDDILLPEEDIVRCHIYFNSFRIKEDENYFYFDGYSQPDVKVNSYLLLLNSV